VTLVDTNVILDLITNDQNWATWSTERLRAAAIVGPLLINDVIYAEISVRYERIEGVEDMLARAGMDVAPIPRKALFLTGKVFAQYCRVGGTRAAVLPDFFIGAHALVSELPLSTRDVSRYRTYFPNLQIISPGTH
jgi:predicted nucleic acid-binding protein